MITLSLIFDNVGVWGLKKILTVIDTVVNLILLRHPDLHRL